MPDVVIHRCPACPAIRERAQALAAALDTELGVPARVEDGAAGELSVFVDGVPMIQRTGADLPTVDEVEEAVRNAAPTGA